MSDARSRRRGRFRTALRRTGLTVVALFLVVTAASVVGNWITTPPDRLEPKNGEYVSVGEARVHYQRWGRGGTPIVLLPGFAETSEAFSLAGPLLAEKGYTVYAPDLSGFGYTRGGNIDDLGDQVGLVSGFVKGLDLHRPVVAGHSMGAAVAGGVAREHADQVRGVLFVDGDAQDLDFGSSPVRSAVAHSPYATSLYRIFTRTGWLNQKALASTCGSGCTAFDGDAGAQRAAERMRPLPQGDVENTMLGRADTTGILHLSEQQMRETRVPRGIIWGAEDEHSGGSLADTRDRLGHPEERIVPRAAHDVMMGNPQGFADAVDGIVRTF